jgi:hypothetical protein
MTSLLNFIKNLPTGSKIDRDGTYRQEGEISGSHGGHPDDGGSTHL